MGDQLPLIGEILPPEPERVRLDSRGRPIRPINGGIGRPHGVRAKKYVLMEKIADNNRVELVETVIGAALRGDMIAMKLILDRIGPRPRSLPLAIELPPTSTPVEIQAAMHELLGRVARGEISTDDGAALVSMAKDILAAHNVVENMLSPQSQPGRPVVDVREMLVQRLT